MAGGGTLWCPGAGEWVWPPSVGVEVEPPFNPFLSPSQGCCPLAGRTGVYFHLISPALSPSSFLLMLFADTQAAMTREARCQVEPEFIRGLTGVGGPLGLEGGGADRRGTAAAGSGGEQQIGGPWPGCQLHPLGRQSRLQGAGEARFWQPGASGGSGESGPAAQVCGRSCPAWPSCRAGWGWVQFPGAPRAPYPG